MSSESAPAASGSMDAPALLRVRGLKVHFTQRNAMGRPHSTLQAVDDLDFDIRVGETYGLVGESGCGKSTTGKAILRLVEPTAGRVELDGQPLSELSGQALKRARAQIPMVFQDPYSSLNPRKRIGPALVEVLTIQRAGTPAEREGLARDMLRQVGLKEEHYDAYPHEFSGGQRQRIGIARALLLRPRLIVCDEPVSALDVSIQAQIVNMLLRMQKELGLAYLFISHDIGVIRHLSHRVGVMYLGRMMEELPAYMIDQALHPYTKRLIAAVPRPQPGRKRERIALDGEMPSPTNPPQGCVFHTRCPLALPICKQSRPILRLVSRQHRVACHVV